MNKYIQNKIINKFGGVIQERQDGRIEWVCKHGVGHTIEIPQNMNPRYDYIHGCDGCCSEVYKFIFEINKSSSFIL